MHSITGRQAPGSQSCTGHTRAGHAAARDAHTHTHAHARTLNAVDTHRAAPSQPSEAQILSLRAWSLGASHIPRDADPHTCHAATPSVQTRRVQKLLPSLTDPGLQTRPQARVRGHAPAPSGHTHGAARATPSRARPGRASGIAHCQPGHRRLPPSAVLHGPAGVGGQEAARG